MCDYVLFENATGYALFEVIEAEDIGTNLEKVQDSILELSRFGKMVKLKAFVPFKSAEEALANINDISEGACSPFSVWRVQPRLLLAGCSLAQLRVCRLRGSCECRGSRRSPLPTPAPAAPASARR